jgi:hypothetical protein
VGGWGIRKEVGLGVNLKKRARDPTDERKDRSEEEVTREESQQERR